MKRLTLHNAESRLEKRRKNNNGEEYDLFKDESLNSLLVRSKRDWEAGEIIQRNGYKLIFTDIAFHESFTINKGTQIKEIICTSDFLFVLDFAGHAFVYNRNSKCIIGTINGDKEFIQSLFFNKENSSLIVVYCKDHDCYQRIFCRSIHLSLITKNQFDKGIEILQSEHFEHPSFVEFDHVNKVLLSFCASRFSYKIWDLKNYELKFEMSGKDVFEVRLSPGNILVILKEKNGIQPVKLIDYASGQVVKSLYLKTQNRGKVLFLELFLDRLFFFQERRDLTIIDPFKEKVLSVVNNFKKPYSFIYMYNHCKYIGFRGNKIAIWNLQGTVDVEFEDNILADAEGKYCTFYLSEEQDVIISSCLVNPMDKNHCTINISEIKTGKLLKKIECELCDITALTFCENRQELFVGHGNGQITVYSVLESK